MNKLGLVIATMALWGARVTAQAAPADIARWEQEAQRVTIVRDDWGIPHIYGKSDADAVFGLMYAQAEDDFNRVETNYINAMGRLAEAEGDSEIYRDLRMKLFINPDSVRAKYAESPEWLKKLMGTFAEWVELLPVQESPGEATGSLPPLRALDGVDLHGREHWWRHRAHRAGSAPGILRQWSRQRVTRTGNRTTCRTDRGRTEWPSPLPTRSTITRYC